ncbi:hypothetical protein GNI_133100 [Gregarina niphandrodes]|uniref:Transmembrane protein n=1 Tax=Gregarina niphandrodes TaxID=110365 RepID=A0A023B1T0_GRENI|nr:hypothetical protein GNI_133100 [Gregarina niphandrodes]EZG46742.1 hypothetical protein GNI_133100 [Gregarina niphandrodes]|eukprot:XP_011132251.1 hypothetical protein GNI_133100 [Gregarina niphandrodes]
MRLASLLVFCSAVQTGTPSYDQIVKFDGTAESRVGPAGMFQDANAMAFAITALSARVAEWVNVYAAAPPGVLNEGTKIAAKEVIQSVPYLRFTKHIYDRCAISSEELPECYAAGFRRLNPTGQRLWGVAYRNFIESDEAWQVVTSMCTVYAEALALPIGKRGNLCLMIGEILDTAHSAAVLSTFHSEKEAAVWEPNYTAMFLQQESAVLRRNAPLRNLVSVSGNPLDKQAVSNNGQPFSNNTQQAGVGTASGNNNLYHST